MSCYSYKSPRRGLGDPWKFLRISRRGMIIPPLSVAAARPAASNTYRLTSWQDFTPNQTGDLRQSRSARHKSWAMTNLLSPAFARNPMGRPRRRRKGWAMMNWMQLASPLGAPPRRVRDVSKCERNDPIRVPAHLHIRSYSIPCACTATQRFGRFLRSEWLTFAHVPPQPRPPGRRILKLNYELRARIYSRGGGDGGDLERAAWNFTTRSYFFSGELAATQAGWTPPRRGGRRLRNDSLTRRPLNSPPVFLIRQRVRASGPSMSRYNASAGPGESLSELWAVIVDVYCLIVGHNGSLSWSDKNGRAYVWILCDSLTYVWFV